MLQLYHTESNLIYGCEYILKHKKISCNYCSVCVILFREHQFTDLSACTSVMTDVTAFEHYWLLNTTRQYTDHMMQIHVLELISSFYHSYYLYTNTKTLT